MDSTGSQSQTAAGHQERIHRLVMDHIDEIVYQVQYGDGEGASPEGVLQFVSNRVKSLLGYEASEFQNDPTLWQRSMHPEDLPTLRESTDRIFATKQAGLRLFRMRHKVTGEYRWLEDRVLPQLDEAGNVIGQFGVARDITEHKEAKQALHLSEERFRIISEQSTLGIFLADTKGECTYINPVLQRLGQRPATDYLGLEWFKVIHPEDRERVIAHWQMAAQNQERFQVVFRSIKPDGGLFWFSATATPIRDAQGLRGYLGLVEDITERTEAQERLRQYADRLQTLSRRLLQTQEAERQLIARELHDEIGQTLTAVKLNLHTLKCPDTPALMEKTLQETMRMVEGLLQQVRQLSLDLHLPQLDYLGLPAALREYVQQQARRAGLHLDFRAVPAMPRPEPAIELACFRVAQEAVTNVVRHAQAKHLAVELLQDAEALHLTVRDDGIGFDYAAARGRVGQGASLGLLSMEERTALTGGRFTCQSAPQQGTEIRACFPLTVAPHANSI